MAGVLGQYDTPQPQAPKRFVVLSARRRTCKRPSATPKKLIGARRSAFSQPLGGRRWGERQNNTRVDVKIQKEIQKESTRAVPLLNAERAADRRRACLVAQPDVPDGDVGHRAVLAPESRFVRAQIGVMRSRCVWPVSRRRRLGAVVDLTSRWTILADDQPEGQRIPGRLEVIPARRVEQPDVRHAARAARARASHPRRPTLP